MHIVLETAELLGLICSELAAANAHESLATLARTSPAFTESALDALWLSQDTIFNLIRLLPDDLWALDTEKRVVFIRATNETDFALFLQYTKRVRHLTCSVFYMGRGLPSGAQWVNMRMVFDSLFDRFRHTVIFPNIRRLGWVVRNTEHYNPWLSLFLGPFLHSIDVAYAGIGSDALLSLIRQSTSVQSLTHCRLSGAPVSLPAMQHVSALLQRLTAVKELVISNLDVPATQTLGQLKHLKTLDIFLPVPADAPLGSIVAHSLPFSSLESLTTTVDNSCGGDLQQLHDFFQLWEAGSVPLRTLQTTVIDEIPSAGLLKDIFCLLADGCAPNTLQTMIFVLQANDRVIRASTTSPHIGVALRPLLRMASLSNVNIELPFGIHVDDSFLGDAAQSWPHLKRLTLARSQADPDDTVTGPIPPSVPPPRSPRPRATLLGLAALAQHCLQLEYLSLSVDTTIPAPESWPDILGLGSTAPTAGSKPWPERNTCPLTCFNTRDSPVTNPPCGGLVSRCYVPQSPGNQDTAYDALRDI
ncbi:hypothetical protein MIND_00908300 [Mycena indigotica]|uniref:F-box domain-containing protein n=1 Tax=Mycena indigotica TaxID=2126181 RepID=A0A8H6VYS0_9AGAR|nr:uncharacterized protein MIND_00908300 [Mycena indigotica]KAF7296776.1 hypothetical protein MIND_00908300 [Mycena indigotica]